MPTTSSGSATPTTHPQAPTPIAVRGRRTPLREQARALVRATLAAARGDAAGASGPAGDGSTIDLRGACPDELVEHWTRVVGDMLRRTPATAGNRVEVFCDGDELFERMWADLDAAAHQAWVETYILEDDRVGRRTIAALAAAARRGCDAILHFDAFGSSSLPSRAIAPVAEAGGRVCVFNPPRWWWLVRRSPLQRNHRKAVVVDGRIAYVGGMNVSEDYAGPRHGRGTFRDCQLRIEGPAAPAIAGTMAEVLCQTEAELCPVAWRADVAERAGHAAAPPADHSSPDRGPPRREPARGALVQVLQSAGRTGRRQIQREMRVAFNAARRSLDIATPYFVPPRALYQTLKSAARRGVRVRIVTAGRSDAPIVTLAARHVYDGLLRRGVRIFELHDVTLHAKTAVVDGVYAMVGSFNLDRWSDKRNLELKVGVVDPDTVAALEREFASLVARSMEITVATQRGRSWHARALQWLAYHALRV